MSVAVEHPVQYLQAVSDPRRLRLLRLLGRGELNVREAVAVLGAGQSTVSKHLAVLRDAGWIRHRKEGTWSWYALREAGEFPGGRALHGAVLAQADAVPEAARDDAALRSVLLDRDRATGEFFDDVAAVWDRIRPAFEHPDVQAGALGALAPEGLDVVDIGTGTGALLPLLAATGARVTAVDNSESMLAEARELCRREGIRVAEFMNADIQDLPLPADRYDAAYSSMVLHHVARPADALREMARIVRPGGKVVVISFTRHDQAWMREKLAHRRLGFSRDEIDTLFRRSGLEPRHWLVRPAAGGVETRAALPDGSEGRDVAWPDVFLAVGAKADGATMSTTGDPEGPVHPPEGEDR